MDVDTKLDMVKDPTSGTDNYISQFVFESCEMRHDKREKRYFSVIVLLIVLLVVTNVAWLFYEAQFQVKTSETVTTTTQTVEATQCGGQNARRSHKSIPFYPWSSAMDPCPGPSALRRTPMAQAL